MPCPAPAPQSATLCKPEFRFVTDLGLINSIRASRPLCCILECVYFHYVHDLGEEDIHIVVSLIIAMFLCLEQMEILSWSSISVKAIRQS